MRAVLDTNVLLPAFALPGLCEQVFDCLVDSPEHRIVLSEHILAEFARQYQAKFGMTAEETRETVGYLRDHADVVQPAAVPPNACRDRGDLPVLGTLLGAKVDCLITGDADLLCLGQFAGRPILSPRQAYEMLR